MTSKQNRKRLLLSVTAVILAAAIGAGVWLTSRSSEPVNVYSFQYIGMTEFWGDMQESYGPVTTDRIQTEFLSDTQSVTEVNVKAGDTVKKGDLLFSFDTTLDSLTLERKRLEVEKIKVQIKAAQERLQETKEMVPYVPPGELGPLEPDLGEELKDNYKISDRIGQDKEIYAGQSPESAIICWLKDGASITDALLQELWAAAREYQSVTPQAPEAESTEAYQISNRIGQNAPILSLLKNETSGMEVFLLTSGDAPEEAPEDPSKDVLTEEGGDEPAELPDQEPAEEKFYYVPVSVICNGETVAHDTVAVGKDGYWIRDSYTYQNKTYWLESAAPKNKDAVLEGLKIKAYPQNETEQAAWEALWKDGVEVRYMRSVTVEGSHLKNNLFAPIDTDKPVELEIGKEAVLMIRSEMKNAPLGTSKTFSVTPSDGVLKISYNGDHVMLSGKPEELTTQPVQYTVTANYSFDDNHGQNRAVAADFSFSVSVVSSPKEKLGEFYVVFKSTEQNFLKGVPVTWQGAKVTAYGDNTFDMQLFDASGFADHTIPVEEDLEIDLPQIDPNAMYTAEEILAMQKQCYATIKEQNEKLKMAEAEYQIMERELGDGKVYAEIDGKVSSILTEEEAKLDRQPFLKVSGGGGFYIEGSISELEKEKLKLGQEVTVNDWSSGSTYTGEVVSIGDFPTGSDSWNGMGNPNASYYPFKAFVAEDAALQAGSYVSISYSTTSTEQGIYLEKAFVRSEKDKHWIYVRGADGRLERRDVRVGRVLWGSYYEILTPLSEEDYLAFPYGKDVKQGAPTVESDLSALYGY